MPVLVLKLGGSLLGLDDLPTRLRAVIARPQDHQPLLVCGGGEAADIVRRWHETHGFDEERSHWLAMAAIRLNQAFLAALLPEITVVATRSDAQAAWDSGCVPLLDLLSFVRAEECLVDVDQRLPHTWNVTSDSLAAWVTLRWPAERLVLLKAVDRPFAATLQDLAEQELVDRHFPIVAAQLPQLDWINLRG